MTWLLVILAFWVGRLGQKVDDLKWQVSQLETIIKQHDLTEHLAELTD